VFAFLFVSFATLFHIAGKGTANEWIGGKKFFFGFSHSTRGYFCVNHFSCGVSNTNAKVLYLD
jgi:hypothetical protein